MQPTLRTIRAIGATFARRAIRPLIISSGIIIAILLGVGAWLITKNAWWWIFEIVGIFGAILYVVILCVVLFLLRRFEPQLTRTQRHAVNNFVDKLERVAEHLHTPQFMIIYYVIRDVVRPSEHSFIANVSHDSKTLAPDFAQLVKTL